MTAPANSGQIWPTGGGISDPELAALAGLVSAADTLPYFTGVGTAALTPFTAAARTLLDDTTTAAMLTTLGAQPLDAELTALAGLTSAADKLPYFTGSGTAALTDLSSTGRSLIDDSSTAAMRTTLGLVIGTDVQGYDADLGDIAAIADARGDLIVRNATVWARVAVGSAGQTLKSDGTDPAWADQVACIPFIIDGGGVVITTGIKGDLHVPFACTILEVTTLADQSGSIVVDLWKDTYANYPPVVGDSITASAKPTLSSATKAQDATLTGWTTSIAAGDTLRYNVDSITTCTRVLVSLKVKKV